MMDTNEGDLGIETGTGKIIVVIGPHIVRIGNDQEVPNVLIVTVVETATVVDTMTAITAAIIIPDQVVIVPVGGATNIGNTGGGATGIVGGLLMVHLVRFVQFFVSFLRLSSCALVRQYPHISLKT
jgi:hypothetical protein